MQKKSGIVRKSDGVSETQLFNFHRDARFGENFSLVLPSVSPEDSGNYECVVSSKVGGQNLNVHVKLTVPGKPLNPFPASSCFHSGRLKHLNCSTHIFMMQKYLKMNYIIIIVSM